MNLILILHRHCSEKAAKDPHFEWILAVRLNSSLLNTNCKMWYPPKYTQGKFEKNNFSVAMSFVACPRILLHWYPASSKNKKAQCHTAALCRRPNLGEMNSLYIVNRRCSAHSLVFKARTTKTYADLSEQRNLLLLIASP